LKSRNDTTHDAVRAQGEAAEAKQDHQIQRGIFTSPVEFCQQ